jgi:hypothetical protein
MARKKNKDNAENWSHKNDYPIEDVWNTDNTLAQLIVPRLQAFKALDKHGHPQGFKDIADWNKAIQKMIDAFELVQPNKVVYSDDYPTIYEGLDLFSKYFLNLWD